MEETGYMAKMRVHELAKELGIENKQIIEFLSTTEHAVKSHSSSIEDDVQKMVRDKFQKKAAPKTETAPKAEAAPKKEAAPKAETAGSHPYCWTPRRSSTTGCAANRKRNTIRNYWPGSRNSSRPGTPNACPTST